MQAKLQGLFDRMVSGVLSQNGVAFDPEASACSYLTTLSTGEVCRCAVGQLFNPDSIDREKYRNMSIVSVRYESPNMWQALKDSLNYSEDEMHQIMQFLIVMQQAHDGAILSVINGTNLSVSTMCEFNANHTQHFKYEFKDRVKAVANRFSLEYNFD